MSTRSHIGKKLEDGSIKFIYCHFDGYPKHNGRILKEHYSTEEQINELLELGDLSSLGENIKECVFYGRDRGEVNVSSSIGTEKQFIKQEYNYLFVDGKWEIYY